jgi:hypothetical protein
MSIKILVLNIFMVCAMHTFAQRDVYYSMVPENPLIKIRKQTPETGVSKLHIYTNRGGSKVPNKIIQYNQDGKVEREVFFNKKGKELRTTSILYTEYGKHKSWEVHEKGKFHSRLEYDYDQNQNLIRADQFEGQPDKVNKTSTYQYNDKNKLIVSSHVNAKGVEYFRSENEYYEQGSIKSSAYYRKGKLHKKRNYDCTDVAPTSKKEVIVCTNENRQDDGTFFVEDIERHKGRVLIVKSIYNNDYKLLRKTRYDHNKRIWSDVVVQYNINGAMERITYAGKNGKPQTEENFSYNEAGRLISISTVKPNGKQVSAKTVEYVMR